MLFLLTDCPQKLKLEKISGTLIIISYVSFSLGVLLNFKGFCFFVSNRKNNHSSVSDWWENTKSRFKEDTRFFSGNIYFFKKIEFSTEKKTANLYKKDNFKPQIKPMIENLPDELYQLENKI